jgi:predicted NAD/FAD-binding protein
MNIAIIGGGIAGLAAARLLYPAHLITLFEKNDYVGGHAHTIRLPFLDPDLVVDSGFIVFNNRNYPEFRGMLAHLNIDAFATPMSFSVSDRQNHIEFSSDWPQGIFADRRNFFRPAYWRFLGEISRFNKLGKQVLQQEEPQPQGITLGAFLTMQNFSAALINQYLIPMAAAIWSASFKRILDFPLRTFLMFLDNHGLLTVYRHPQWYTIKGGSRAYVDKLVEPFQHRIRHQEVIGVHRKKSFIEVTSLTKDHRQQSETFDHVIFASHADETMALLKTPTPEELEFLKAFPYQKNDVYLHQDDQFMPKRRRAWASWNTLIDKGYKFENPVCVTYWMNRLQNIPLKFPLFITLNPGHKPNSILQRFSYDHPQFTQKSLYAQKKLSQIQGKDRIWYCGSYLGYGFHEDALKSGIDVALKLGEQREWVKIDA